jgi:linoleoyl-CoA desaturase
LSDADVEALGREFDAIRRDIEESRGESDAAYIARIISIQRQLMVAGRLTLFASSFPPAWVAGTTMLAVGKILENMEIGHNVMHGQWDWMNDPEIHSGTWEWDNTCPAEQWKHSHNYVHHTFTNVLEKDNDVGYGVLRVTSDQKWHPANLGQPIYYALLALLFEWGVALHDLDIVAIRKREKDSSELGRQLKGIWRKVRRQVGKDYLIFPLLSGPNFLSTLSANVTANLVRNVWSNIIIFCGHFPDGAEKFTEEELDDESKAEWYLRQILGSANFEGSRFLHIMAGSLGYQIEHHLFPDLPSNRYPEIAERVRALCQKYDIPYTTGPLYRQYGQVLRTLLRLSLPTRSVTPESDSPAPAGPVRRNCVATPAPGHRRRPWPDPSDVKLGRPRRKAAMAVLRRQGRSRPL